MFRPAPNLCAACLTLLIGCLAGCGDDGGTGGDGAVDLGRSDDGGTPGSLDMPPPPPCTPSGPLTLRNVIPMPASVVENGGAFCLSQAAEIRVDTGSAELLSVGQALAARLRPSTGYALPVNAADGAPAAGSIQLTSAGADATLGDEGYQLTITPGLVRIAAYRPAGLFRAVQTLRQLLPAAIEQPTVHDGPWPIATGAISDAPRFAWRGAMLDVARHFFSVADVERYIDLLAYYKINRFHLHLSDDQGWRIAIQSWPALTTVGGSTEVGGAKGAFYYSSADYQNIVAYAAARYITVIPEIDGPGHTNAALASYAQLNCNNVAPALYTGTSVGFSSLCIGNANTKMFVSQVLGELAQMTPSPYLHIGGDEASSTSAADYAQYMNDAQATVKQLNKIAIGWGDIANATLAAGTIAQHWNPFSGTTAQQAVQQHAKVILSPANRTYLDMKYDSSTPLGQEWAGDVNEQQAYQWEPATLIPGVGEGDILGIESALWTETIITRGDIDYMTFPRLAGHAEIGWSPAAGRNWDEYKLRIASHGPRLTALGVNFYKSARIPWP